MSLGAITTDAQFNADGPVYHARVHFTGNTAYAAGGEPGFKATVSKAIGIPNMTLLACIDQGSDGGYRCFYNETTDSLQVFNGTNEVAPGNLSATTFYLYVVGY